MRFNPWCMSGAQIHRDRERAVLPAQDGHEDDGGRMRPRCNALRQMLTACHRGDEAPSMPWTGIMKSHTHWHAQHRHDLHKRGAYASSIRSERTQARLCRVPLAMVTLSLGPSLAVPNNDSLRHRSSCPRICAWSVIITSQTA